jgi:hypothetical protein
MTLNLKDFELPNAGTHPSSKKAHKNRLNSKYIPNIPLEWCWAACCAVKSKA